MYHAKKSMLRASSAPASMPGEAAVQTRVAFTGERALPAPIRLSVFGETAEECGTFFARLRTKNSDETNRCTKGGTDRHWAAAVDAGAYRYTDNAGRRTARRRPHNASGRRRNPDTAAGRAGRDNRQPVDRQHGEPGLTPPRTVRVQQFPSYSAPASFTGSPSFFRV